jgi:hypothetical protein
MVWRRGPTRKRFWRWGHDCSEEGEPSHFRKILVPRLWFCLINAGAVFFLPFLTIYWKDELGFSAQQVGLLQAFRPWVNAACGEPPPSISITVFPKKFLKTN